jgi:hypothetical protein
MPFLTQSGLDKIESLKKEIQSISEKKYEDPLCTSDYSQRMVTETLDILNYIQKNNETSLGKDEIKKIATSLEQSISFIDNKKLTGVPAIFNTESFLLAKAFRDFLKDLNSGKDIHSIVSIALQMKMSKASKSDIFQQHICEIDINIQLYDLLAKANTTHKIFNKMKARLAARINYYKSTEIHDDIDTLKVKYKEFINSTLHEMKSIPSHILENTSVYQYYNQALPYDIDTNNLNIIGITSFLYKQLINLENTFNKLLPPENPVSFVIDTMREVFTKEQVEEYRANVFKQLQALEKDLNAYLTGKHLGFFQKIHPEKIKLINSVQTQIKIASESKAIDSSVCNAFDIYKILVIASIENLKFSKQNKISPGRSGNILAKYQSKLLSLTMDRPVGSDEEHYTFYCKTAEKPLSVNLGKS